MIYVNDKIDSQENKIIMSKQEREMIPSLKNKNREQRDFCLKERGYYNEHCTKHPKQ